MTAGADTPIACGVYRGAAVDIAPVQAYEQFLGMPTGTTVDWVLAFMADNPSWAQFEAGALQSSTNGPPGSATAADWVPLLGPRNLMLGVPACCGGTTWAQEASGVNDAHWAAFARGLVSAGLGNAALRIAREFNTSYRWQVNPGNVAAFQSAWARIAGILRANGFTGALIWNPMHGQGSFGPNGGAEAGWPGNAYVDAVGIDLYDEWGYPAGEMIRSTAQQQAQWAAYHDASTWDGLTGWHSFAASHGKPLCYPEWGLGGWNTGTTYTGGGDNPVFVREMAAWIKDTAAPGNPLSMQAMWEDPGMGVADPDAHERRRVAVPQARAAYLAAFGYQN